MKLNELGRMSCWQQAKHSPGLKGTIFHSSEFSAYNNLILTSAIPHCGLDSERGNSKLTTESGVVIRSHNSVLQVPLNSTAYSTSLEFAILHDQPIAKDLYRAKKRQCLPHQCTFYPVIADVCCISTSLCMTLAQLVIYNEISLCVVPHSLVHTRVCVHARAYVKPHLCTHTPVHQATHTHTST